MSLALVTPPALEPLTVAEVQAHLRLDSANQEPAPDAPTVALAAGGAGSVDNGTHRYCVTFVTADGETQGGTISGPVTVADHTVNGQVTVSNVPIGGSSVTARRLYRTAANGSSYFLAATIADNVTTSVTDNGADASLGVGVPTRNTTLDGYLKSLITAARQHAENVCHVALISSTWRFITRRFPAMGFAFSALESTFAAGFFALEIPQAPLLSVTSLQYIDPTGALQTLDPSAYTVDSDSVPGRILLNVNQVWPATALVENAVRVTFVAGFGASAATVPAPITSAMKLLIGHWFQNRQAVGDIGEAIPIAVDALLAPYVRQAMEMA